MKDHEIAQTQDDQDDSIVALCPKCNRVVFWALNDPRLINQAEIGRMALAGRIIKHMTVAESRQQDFACHCRKEKS